MFLRCNLGIEILCSRLQPLLGKEEATVASYGQLLPLPRGGQEEEEAAGEASDPGRLNRETKTGPVVQRAEAGLI